MAGIKRIVMVLGVLFCALGAWALPVSVTSTPQLSKEDGWWMKRHRERLALATNMPEVVFLGDSITHFWESQPSWKTYFAKPYRALNLGYCSDRTENVLWRIDHGELDGYRAKAVVLMIGTNNSGAKHCPEDTLLGIRTILDRVLQKQPSARVILTPIFPRGETCEDPARKLNDIVNLELPQLADGERVIWCDFTDRFLSPNDELSPELFPDYLHPSSRGYEIWAGAVKPMIESILNAPAEASIASVWPSCPHAYRFGASLASIASSDIALSGKRYESALSNRTAIVSGPKTYDVVLLGGTVMAGWEGQGRAEMAELRKYYAVLDLACPSIKTQQLLWRLENGELDGYTAKAFMLTIGQDDHGFTPEQTAEGISAIVRAVLKRHPESKMLLFPTLYRGEQKTAAARVPTQKVNAIIAKIADGDRVRWIDFNERLLDKDGGVDSRWTFCTVYSSAAAYGLWRKEIEPTLDEICLPADLRPIRIVAFGDSITEASIGIKPDESWLSIVQARLGNGYRTYNAGVGGNSAREAMRRYERDVLSRKPDIVLIEFGGNNHDPGNPDRRVGDEEFRSLLGAFRDGLPKGCRVVAVTFPPLKEDWHRKYQGVDPEHYCGNAVLDVQRQILRDFACENGWPVVDLYAIMKDRHEELVLPDGVHLNPEGQKVFADAVMQVIPRLVSPDKSRHDEREVK